MNSKTIFGIAGVLLMLFLPIGVSAAVVHAIIVGDTNDETIGEAVEKDVEHLEKLMGNIREYAGVEVKEIMLVGDEFTQNNLMNALDQLHVSAEKDVIIFYYAGHGYRLSETESPWPDIAVPPYTKNIPFEKVVSALKQKKPRFFIAISEACNKVIPQPPSPIPTPSSIPKSLLIPESSMGNGEVWSRVYKELFLDYQGYIVASSASTGQLSWSGEQGGFFTYTFFTSLQNHIFVYKPDWSGIMTASAEPIYVGNPPVAQRPQYQFELNYKGKRSLADTTQFKQKDDGFSIPNLVSFGRILLQDFSLNNKSNKIVVTPGQCISASAFYNYYCPGCAKGSINQIIIGLEGDDSAQACIYSGEIYGGGSAKFTLTAPKIPGDYYVRFRYAQAYNCEDAKQWWKVDGVPFSHSNVGMISVQEEKEKSLEQEESKE